jgi:hypothetical protein
LNRELGTPISKLGEGPGGKGLVRNDEYNFRKAAGKGGVVLGVGGVEPDTSVERKRFGILGGRKLDRTTSVEKKMRVSGSLNNTVGFETKTMRDSSYDELKMYSRRAKKATPKTAKLRARVVSDSDTKRPADYSVYSYNIPFDFTL